MHKPNLPNYAANISIILTEPQMGENIGATARAMKNFGLTDLRIVSPRDGWPNPAAEAMSVKAIDLINSATIYKTLKDAISDLEIVIAATCQKRNMNKRVISSNHLFDENIRRKKLGIIFGRESSGLTNDEISLADYILSIPTTDFNSLNLAQAVCIICYELFTANEPKETGKDIDNNSFASKEQKEHFYTMLFEKLEDGDFFRNNDQRKKMELKIRNLFNRIDNMSIIELNSLIGIIKSLSNSKGSKKKF